MLTQYSYALATMVPCPLWFWYRWASAGFLLTVFVWSIYNGATFYIDVFGKRFQRELEQLKQDVAKWQTSPEMAMQPDPTPKADVKAGTSPPSWKRSEAESEHRSHDSIDQIPMLDVKGQGATGAEGGAVDNVRERK